MLQLFCFLFNAFYAQSLKMQELPRLASAKGNASQVDNAWSRYFHEELDHHAGGKEGRRRRRRRDDDDDDSGPLCAYEITGCADWQASYVGPLDYMYPDCWYAKVESDGTKPNVDCQGKEQSPINIDTTVVNHAAQCATPQACELHIAHTAPALGVTSPSAAGHHVVFKDEGGLRINFPSSTQQTPGVDEFTWAAKKWALLSVHLHMPSEHTRDGETFDGELHLLHRKKGSTRNNNLLIIAFLIKHNGGSDQTVVIGASGVAVSQEDLIFTNLFGLQCAGAGCRSDSPTDGPSVAGFSPGQYGDGSPGATQLTSGTPVSLDVLLDGVLASTAGSAYPAPTQADGSSGQAANRAYFVYDGSLTTPPCTASVKWIIADRFLYANDAQIRNFKLVFAPRPNGNSRPLQVEHGRTPKLSPPQSVRGGAGACSR